LVLVLLPSGAFWAVWLPDAVSRDGVLSAPGAASSARRDAAGCGGAVAGALAPSAAAVFESTSAPKLSLDCEGSLRAGFGGAA
jgi:hypothetical protein